MAKKVLKVIGIVALCIGVAFGVFLLISTIFEYRPEDLESLSLPAGASDGQTVAAGDSLSLMTYNIGYAGLGAGEDFFMDGGEKVQPDSEDQVQQYLSGITQVIAEKNADVTFVQEADLDSQRSYHIDEVQSIEDATGKNGAFAYNFKSIYTPYPMPPIGKVESGLLTLTDYNVESAARVSLPVPFKWPVSMFNLKRCLLVERVPVEGGSTELVLVNLHLEAYDDGEGKAAQTEKLMGFLQDEYAKGNYVIAGGDFNQTFPGGLYPVISDDWQPGVLSADMLPDGWQFAYDSSAPTCRLLNHPYTGDPATTQYYVIDGFILSPNVQMDSVETLDLDFQNSDHNPVLLQATLV